MGFVEREMDRLAEALREPQDGTTWRELHAAQQALEWSREPHGFAAPSTVLLGHAPDAMGSPAAPVDCSDEARRSAS